MKWSRVFLPALLVLAGCHKQATVQKGATVKINYTLTVDGHVIDTSTGKPPLSYVQGMGQMIPGLEEQLEGMKVGDKKQVTVPPEKGYGLVDPSAVRKVPKTAFPNQARLKVGGVVGGQAGNRPFRATIKEIGAKDVTLDMNHPLAGKTLQFDVEIVDIQPGTGT